MNILEELKLSKKQSKDERYEYLCSQFNAVDYAMKLEKYTIKLQQENKQLKEVIEEVRELIPKQLLSNVNITKYTDEMCLRDILQILDKAKENK